MKTTTTAATIDSSFDIYNESIYSFGVFWAFSMALMVPVGCLLTMIVG